MDFESLVTLVKSGKVGERLRIAANTLASQPIAICRTASVVAEAFQGVASAPLASGLTVIRVTAHCTTGEPL